jgi:DNA-binding protein H-NS
VVQNVRLFRNNPKGDDPVALKAMSIDKLMKLKSQVESTLALKVSEHRRSLESELSKLGHFQSGKRATRGSLPVRHVAPKYRNPENPAETWAGRGLKPRWLAAALKSGKKIDDFAIAANGRGKRRKAAKKK